ncbi:polysaccharide biosynthesis/export family protein [Pontibacter sp. KCTC 32443]|uniref:polysaccharide biosynthesis/export family protein n=1 Tax=Pontibacter TaxID=323449 RepID=UPI00164E5BA4|nr:MULTISPECIES: polysaccharide biosynthesis/export family protein [Pontibacter]MBC5773003.1 polysaccharide biosynthesis/export family protein [Pontibacter sp. KCTC 32443]
MRIELIYLVGLLLVTSCGPTRNLAYFSDLKEQTSYSEEITNLAVSKIQPNDLLSITVSSKSPESDLQFNRGMLGAAENKMEGYLVDESGFIDFPVVGRVKLAGLTKQEAKDTLTAQLGGYLKDPVVQIRNMNFKISVIGEVNRPSTFTVPAEKISILEALGMAGDMTPFGKRENVIVMREEAGKRTMTRLDLNKKDVLSSPYFYLQQNDVVYVEPDKMKQVQASTNTRNLAILTSLTSLAIVIASRIF